LPVFFTRQAPPGFTLQSFSLTHSRSASRRPLPSCRCLQNRPRSPKPAFRALLHARVRWLPTVFPPLWGRPDALLGFPSPRLSPFPTWHRLHDASSRLSAPPLPVGLPLPSTSAGLSLEQLPLVANRGFRCRVGPSESQRPGRSACLLRELPAFLRFLDRPCCSPPEGGAQHDKVRAGVAGHCQRLSTPT